MIASNLHFWGIISNPWFWLIIPKHSSNQHYCKRETGGLPLTAVKFKVNHVCDCGLLHFFHMPILHKILHAFFRILVLKKYFFIIFKKIMKKVFWFVGWAFSGAVLIFFPFQSKFESLIWIMTKRKFKLPRNFKTILTFTWFLPFLWWLVNIFHYPK